MGIVLGVVEVSCSSWVSKFNYLISYVGQRVFTKTLPHSLIMEKERSIMKRNNDNKNPSPIIQVNNSNYIFNGITTL